MKKYLPLLENNVQWIALGLGALFMLYMVYANLLTPRANVPINGESIAPGQVEGYIKDKAVTQLEGIIKDDPRQVPNELKIKPEFVKVFPDPQPTENIVVTAIPVMTVALPDKTSTPGGSNPNPGPNPVAGVQVNALPAVKEVTNLRVEASRASVDLSPPVAANPNNPNPVLPVAVQGADIDYVSVAFDFPMTDLAAEFRKVKIPATFTTAFIEVQLIREEKNDAGQWVNEMVVGKLNNAQQPPLPNPKDRAVVSGYISWAEANQDKIIQPKFYDIVKGDAWHVPGDKVVAAQQPGNGGAFPPKPPQESMIRQGFDPANPPPDMTLAEKQAKYKFDLEKKRKEQAEKNKNRPTPGGPPGGRGGRGGPGGPGLGGGGPGGEGGFGNFPPTSSQGSPAGSPTGATSLPGSTGPTPFQQVGAAGNEGMGPGGFPRGGYPNLPGQIPGEFGPGMGIPGANGPAGPMPCPVGPFDPRTLNMVITGWAHDATVQPGKTYHYKVRYSIKNPIYGAKGLANPPALANDFNLVSKDSVWTDEVTISQRAYYYLTQANDVSGKASFEVFTFADGQWNKEVFPVVPGDIVGSNKNGVNYATGYTLVDVRSEKGGNDQVVVLADASGVLSRKSKRADSADATRAKLIAQMAAGVAPATPGTPTAPGGSPDLPGMPGMPDDRSSPTPAR